MEFLNTALTFPTVVFSVLLIIVILFWLITIVGLADIDMFEADVELETQANTASTLGIFNNLGLSEVPLTVSASIIIMTAWLISIYSQAWFLAEFKSHSLYYVFGALIILACSIISLPISALITKPLRRFFTSKQTANKHDFIGLECTIATSKVTQTFGQARVTLQGAEQLIEIRVQDPTHQFNLGDTALLIEHLVDSRSYVIAPKPWS
jgi:hypothetical protein